MDPDGMGGEGFPPSLANASSPSSTTSNPTGGVDSTHPVPVILRISPANAGDMAGYIHLAYNEIIHRSAVVAYFDSAGREVEVIPCPDFDAFFASHSLRTRNVSFLMDLLGYILESGCRILADNDHSIGDVRPDLSWLPTSLSPPLAPSRSSQSLLLPRPTNTSTDCHLLYEPIGRAACLADLDYVQPKYLVDKSASSSATALSTRLPAIIEPDDTPDDLPTFASHWPKRPPSPPLPPVDMSLLPPSTYTKRLKDLDRDELIQRLYSVEHPVPPSPSDTKLWSSTPLECMEREDILTLLHHPNTSPPAI